MCLNTMDFLLELFYSCLLLLSRTTLTILLLSIHPSIHLNYVLNIHLIPRQRIQPPLHILLHRTLNRTLIHFLHRLRLQDTLIPRTAAPMEHTAIIHNAL
jgi:hypothetical protein